MKAPSSGPPWALGSTGTAWDAGGARTGLKDTERKQSWIWGVQPDHECKKAGHECIRQGMGSCTHACQPLPLRRVLLNTTSQNQRFITKPLCTLLSTWQR